jgi:hypothetical protein
MGRIILPSLSKIPLDFSEQCSYIRFQRETKGYIKMIDTTTEPDEIFDIMQAAYRAQYGKNKFLPMIMGDNAFATRKAWAIYSKNKSATAKGLILISIGASIDQVVDANHGEVLNVRDSLVRKHQHYLNAMKSVA